MATDDRIIIFDTTLRDGEQAPGCSMTLEEKVRVAAQLERLKVDVIEAGFPIASPGDFESVREVSRAVTEPVVAGLARCVAADIDRAGEALQDAKRARIHVFLATSRIHREYKLKKGTAEIVELAVRGVKRALQYQKDVEFSPEDASRTEPQFLREVVEAVIDAGATTINIPDTVGYAVPSQFAEVIAMLMSEVSNIEQAVISVHCHDDLGMAVANSLAAVQAGARQVECCINGLGERAGNAALEEVVMALATRKDAFDGCWTGVKTERLYPTSRLVSRVTGLSVARNKAVVGENAFAHESGIHADGVLKKRTTYEIMDPKAVGVAKSTLVLGKHSGRHQFRQRLKELGFRLSAEAIDHLFFGPFKALADRKGEIFDEDIEALVESEVLTVPETWRIRGLQVATGTAGMPTATVELEEVGTGEPLRDAATGDGPVDAIFRAVERLTGVSLQLSDYQIRSVTGGKEAQGEVRLEARHGDATVTGRGVSTDVLEASARAFVNCINRALARGRAGKTAAKKKVRKKAAKTRTRSKRKRK